MVESQKLRTADILTTAQHSQDHLQELVLNILRGALVLALHGCHEHVLLRLQVVHASPQLAAFCAAISRHTSRTPSISHFVVSARQTCGTPFITRVLCEAREC